MAAGWFRDKSDNKLVSSADSEMMPPLDHDFILASQRSRLLTPARSTRGAPGTAPTTFRLTTSSCPSI